MDRLGATVEWLKDKTKSATNRIDFWAAAGWVKDKAKSATATVGMIDKFNYGCSLGVDGKEIYQKQIGLKSLTSACLPMPYPLGICLQGVEYSHDEDNNETRMCLGVVLSEFSVGARVCGSKGSNGLVPSVETMNAEYIAKQSSSLFKSDSQCVSITLSQFIGRFRQMMGSENRTAAPQGPENETLFPQGKENETAAPQCSENETTASSGSEN